MSRLDQFLFENHYFPTREKAKEAIIENIVSVNQVICTKPAYKVKDGDLIEIIGTKLKYVSRAGLKLEKAASVWNISFEDKTILDVGASTGGFTDFCIQNGARKVYAIDVGTNQLHEKLKHSPKVVNMEKTDFRSIESLPGKIDIAVCDCSFISLKLLAPNFSNLLQKDSLLVVLIKPQFECGKDIASKAKGIIKDQKIQENIKKDIVQFFEQYSFNCLGTCESPILGTAGNKEFLAYFIKK